MNYKKYKISNIYLFNLIVYSYLRLSLRTFMGKLIIVYRPIINIAGVLLLIFQFSDDENSLFNSALYINIFFIFFVMQSFSFWGTRSSMIYRRFYVSTNIPNYFFLIAISYFPFIEILLYQLINISFFLYFNLSINLNILQYLFFSLCNFLFVLVFVFSLNLLFSSICFYYRDFKIFGKNFYLIFLIFSPLSFNQDGLMTNFVLNKFVNPFYNIVQNYHYIFRGKKIDYEGLIISYIELIILSVIVIVISNFFEKIRLEYKFPFNY